MKSVFSFQDYNASLDAHINLLDDPEPLPCVTLHQRLLEKYLSDEDFIWFQFIVKISSVTPDPPNTSIMKSQPDTDTNAIPLDLGDFLIQSREDQDLSSDDSSSSSSDTSESSSSPSNIEELERFVENQTRITAHLHEMVQDFQRIHWPTSNRQNAPRGSRRGNRGGFRGGNRGGDRGGSRGSSRGARSNRGGPHERYQRGNRPGRRGQRRGYHEDDLETADLTEFM